MLLDDIFINVENIEGDLTPFLIYDKFLEKLDKKISPEKDKKVDWFVCYVKIFKNWIKNVNYEDVERRIGFVRSNLSKTLKKVRKKNSQIKNFISEQINEKFKYEIKKYNFVKSFDDLNMIKNEEKFENDKNEKKRISVQIFNRKNLNIDLNKKTEFEKFNINNKNNRNLKHKFSMNFSSSTNFSNNKNSNSLINNKEINYFKKNNNYSNKINLKKFSTDFPKKIILKENKNNFDNNLYYIENSNFNKIKLDFNNDLNKKNTKIKPFFLDEINLLHQLEMNDFLNGGTKNYKTEKYFQLFNFHNLFLAQNFDDLENDKQILDAKETCDEIMRIFNSKIYMNSHLLDLEKY